MRASELRGRDAEDLRRELEALRRELFDMNFQWQTEENPNTSRRQELRRDIARYCTVLREAERAGSGEGPGRTS
jgi:large subunit ribosomal protein L29